MENLKPERAKEILKVENLNKSFIYGDKKTHVLKDISFRIQVGEFIIIHGESGSGKSTLLNILSGFENFESGKVVVCGTEIKGLNESKRAIFRRDNIGFVFQQFHLMPELTALENVMLPLLIRKVRNKEAKIKAEKMLSYVGLEDRLNNTPEQLSGGQNQRIAVARALITEASIIFADEPTGNLDSKNRGEILKLLKNINKDKRTTVVMVTHSIEEKKIGDRAIEIKDGLIV